jgi:Holliday junction resolvase RusA-like endonuclease
MTSWTIRVSCGDRMPSLNRSRVHWAIVSREAKRMRTLAAWGARKQRIPHQDHVTVALEFTPRDRRRRDVDNLTGALKHLCDGLVDAHVVDDDTPAYMTKLMPTIGAPARVCGKRLTLTITSGVAA